ERCGEVSLDFPRLRVEQHQPALVVGDENPAALVDLQPVRPAVVLHDQLPFPFRVDPEYAPEGNVHAPQVPVAIERGTFEKAVDLSSAPVGVGPSGAALLAELRRQRGGGPGLDAGAFRERVVQLKRRLVPDRLRYFFIRSLTGSLTFSILSISTLTRRPPTFSTRRIYTVWTMSRVSGSIAIGPRGLSHFMPLAAAMSASASVLPPVFFRAS